MSRISARARERDAINYDTSYLCVQCIYAATIHRLAKFEDRCRAHDRSVYVCDRRDAKSRRCRVASFRFECASREHLWEFRRDSERALRALRSRPARFPFPLESLDQFQKSKLLIYFRYSLNDRYFISRFWHVCTIYISSKIRSLFKFNTDAHFDSC